MEAEVGTERAWDALPSPALLNIFIRTSIRDRTRNLPLVCRSWAQATRHPGCWASIVAYSISYSLEDAFVKFSSFLFSYGYEGVFVDPFRGRRPFSNLNNGGATRLLSVVRRASSTTTSLYFFPFLTAVDQPPNDDAILRLVAHNCPSLKHLSFHGSYRASEEAVLEVIRSCRKLELIDFSDSPYFIPSVLKELSLCCPNIKGIRRNGYIEPLATSALLTTFPSLELLNLSGTPILDKDLLTIVTGCLGLQYLDVRECHDLVRYMYIIKRAPHISQILFD